MPTASLILTANTAQAGKNLEDLVVKLNLVGRAAGGVGGNLRVMGTGANASSAEASAFVRALDLNFGNATRTVARFATEVLKLGPLFKAAFPVISLLFFGDMIVQLGQKVQKFYTDVAEGPEKTRQAFLRSSTAIQESADALGASNAKLENQLAQLTGQRENHLKVSLYEARVEADKLILSLAEANDKEEEVFKKHEVGFFKGLATGVAQTDQVQESLKRLAAENISRARSEQQALAEASETQAPAVIARNAQREVTALGKQRDQITADLRNAQVLQRKAIEGIGRAPGEAPGGDQSQVIADLEGQLSDVTASLNAAKFNQQRIATQQKIDTTSDIRPYNEKITELNARLRGTQAELGTIGKSDAFRAQAKGAAEAITEIERLNKLRREKFGDDSHALAPAEEAAMRKKYGAVAAGEEQVQWGNKVSDTIKKLQEQTAAQNLLSAAIGRGYEAQRQAAIQAAVVEKLGPADGSARYAHAARLTAAAEATAYDAKQNTVTTEAIEKLQERIGLENALAGAQRQGAEAVRLAALAYDVETFSKTHDAAATAAYRQAQEELHAATQRNASAAKLTDASRELEATRALIAAGSPLARQELEIARAYDEARRAGDDEATARAIAEKKRAQYLSSGQEQIEQLALEAEHQRRLATAVTVTAQAEEDRRYRHARIERTSGKDVADQDATVEAGRYVQQMNAEARKLQAEITAAERIAQAGTAEQLLAAKVANAADENRAKYDNLILANLAARKTKLDEENRIHEEAVALGSQYSATLEKIGKLEADILKTQAASVERATALRDLEKEKLQAAIDYDLRQNRPRASTDAFFLNMQLQAQQTGMILYNALNGAVEGVSDQLAKLMTGQKADWGKMFQDLGEQTLKASLKTGLSLGLGQLGKTLGVNIPNPTAKRGESAEAPLYVQVVNGGGGTGGEGSASDLFNVFGKPGSSGFPSGGGGFGGLLTGLFGGAGEGFSVPESAGTFGMIPMAEGGSVDPGHAYWVGEHGPEPFVPHTAGSIIPHRNLGGEVHHHYSMDFRGAELGVENRVNAALAQVHQASVATSVRANHERMQRTPQKGH